jgi:PadR family transcriptional regulator PadR
MRAALAMCVLRTLTDGPTYGYAIAGALEDAGFGVIKGGTLYPLLARLEASGWVTTEWRAGEGGPGRKYFALTTTGQHELQRQSSEWDSFTRTVRKHLNDNEGTS